MYTVTQLGTFGLGSPIQIQAAFTASGVAGDPTSVFCEITDPHGTTTTYTYNTSGTWTHTNGTGIYVLTITPTIAGTWVGRFYSTGTGQASQDFSLTVAISQDYP